jgi:hypothetical protein
MHTIPKDRIAGEGRGGIYHLLELSGREPSNWQFPVPGGGRKIKRLSEDCQSLKHYQQVMEIENKWLLACSTKSRINL